MNDRSRMMRLIDEILDEFKDINYAYNDSSKFDTLKRMLIDSVEELQQFVDHYEQTAKDYWKEACEYKQRIAELEAKVERLKTWSMGVQHER